MTRYEEQIRSVVRAVAIHGSRSFTWFGQRQPLPLPTSGPWSTPDARRAYLRYYLESRLYRSFYTQGDAIRDHDDEPPALPAVAAPFVRALSEANCGTGCWTVGWRLDGPDGEWLRIASQDLKLRARSEDCAAVAQTPSAGEALRVRLPHEYLNISPGFYLAVGNAVADSPGTELVRWYWHTTAPAAVLLMRRLTTLLNAEDVPFQLKTVNHPAGYTRCDATVLYTRKVDCSRVVEPLARVYAEAAALLRPAVPAFTKALAPGLGLAEDPAARESFGMARCRALAEGLLQAAAERRRAERHRVAAIGRCFAERGLRVDAPYLNAGSVDVYEFAAAFAAPSSRPRTTRRPAPAHDDEDLRAAAIAIGDRLVREAVWHENRCNWLAFEFSDRGSAETTLSPLGPDLYSGTAGIAAFLARLWMVTRDDSYRRTAHAALATALRAADRVDPSQRLGLFTGWTGMALAAAQVGLLTGHEWLLDEARRLAGRCRNEPRDAGAFDLLSGRGGAIVAALALARLVNEPGLAGFAEALGDELLAAADLSDGGCSWRAPREPRQPNLTGLSHGAAGAAVALLQLFEATGQDRYRSTADQAFAYEATWFDARRRNWIDLRNVARRTPAARADLVCSNAWCHGAPGIALSRLLAWKVTRAAGALSEARAALETTLAETRAWMHSGSENYSLCHGVCGNADVLLSAMRLLGADEGGWHAFARAAGRRGLEVHQACGAWPCGSRSGEAPGLMLGLAGIGSFYLRLCQPEMPSPLGLEPGEAARHTTTQ